MVTMDGDGGGRKYGVSRVYLRLALAVVASAAVRVALGVPSELHPASWVKQNVGRNEVFPARSSHGVTTLGGRLWVVGGRSEEFQTYDLEFTNRRADVWSSQDYGETWQQSTNLWGDFYLQNHNAPNPGQIAPWWARFGHTLDTVEAIAADGMPIEVMVITGGFTPEPYSDVWISPDGSEWRFAGTAPWSGRAWHASTIVDGKLWIMGGTPLSNDVWVMDRLYQTDEGPWVAEWSSRIDAAPWNPRCGMQATTLPRADGQTVFLTGGFGGVPNDSPSWDGDRSLGDVWKTHDGATWELVTESAPWGPRAWHSVAVWSDARDPTTDIVAANNNGFTYGGGGSRMWLAGGGYIGQRGNHVVRSVVAHVDLWFSLDGINWIQVNYQEGSIAKNNMYSSMDWSQTLVDDKTVYRGLWGHAMVAWDAPHESASGETSITTALYIIGGDYDGSGSLSNSVFVSIPVLICSRGGIVCGGVGTCGDFDGCQCPPQTEGDFCDSVVTV